MRRWQMRSPFVALSVVVWLGMLQSCGGGGPTALNAEDKAFIHESAVAGIMEVQLGQIAAGQATNEEVKAFGKRMVTDHSNSNQELMELATKKGVTLPKEMDEKHQKIVQEVARLSGAEFDREYMNTMVKDHEQDIEKFRKASGTVKDPDLKNFVTQTLPALEEHLKHAREVQGKL